MSTGIIKFWSEKGFGFILVDDPEEGTPKEIFYHGSNSLDRVEMGERVSFLISKNQRGPCAVQVRRIKSGNNG